MKIIDYKTLHKQTRLDLCSSEDYFKCCLKKKKSLCVCILRVNESPLWVRCLASFMPVPSVGKRGHLG